MIRFLVIGFAVLLSGCGLFKEPVEAPQVPLVKVLPRNYPQFFDSRSFEGLNRSIDQSLVYFKRVPLSRKYAYGKDIFDAGHMIRSMERFQALLAKNYSIGELNASIKKEFLVYRSAGNDKGEVLFTGYYEPTYNGSLEPDPAHIFPVYSKPTDLVQIDLSLFSEKYKGEKRLTARVNPDTR
ncbi:MAG: murein transglycosylase, partial [Desulfobacteraceae bacterium]|nr:murein transglycosylase [Desulfobacteraceae bacterium]